ncbi:MAG: histidine kinase [Vallitalea sp.]|jgi:two-component system sensor histidine kinase YesM|nr:histidine kinase [Vallitalea sp.]MCT4597383.1 histidine kinase [Vallitalea sp.]
MDLIKLNSQTLDNNTYVSSINNLRDELIILNNNNEFIKYIRLYIPTSGIAINSNWNNISSLQYLNDAEFDEILSYSKQEERLVKKDNEFYLYIFPKKYQFQNIIELCLDLDSIKRYLESEFVIPESNYIFFTADSTQVVAQKIDSASYEIFETNKYHTLTDSFIEKNVSSDGNVYYLYGYHMVFLGSKLYTIIPSSTYFAPLNNSISFTSFTLAFLLISTSLLLLGIIRLIHKPLHALSDGFDVIKKGNFDIKLQKSKTIDFNYIYNSFNSMVEDMKFLIEENYQKKMLLQQAQLKQMQAQINPHFLYNSFYMLKQMIRRGNQEESEEVANQLGQYFRYITKFNSDTVTLKNEYEHALNYASIQALRFKSRIQVYSEPLPESYDNIIVPKLILQPLLENAYKHGLEAKIENGYIKISITTLDSYLVFTIEDNGDQLTKSDCAIIQSLLSSPLNEHDMGKTGALLNIAGRMKIFYQQDYLLQINLTPQGGALVTLKIPIESNEPTF